MAEANKNITGTIKGLSVHHTDAYAIAVRNGYTGTEAEWLRDLVGKSAYEIAVAHGFKGTEQEWLAYLAEEANAIAKGYANAAGASATKAEASNVSAGEHAAAAKVSKESAEAARDSAETAVNRAETIMTAAENATTKSDSAVATSQNAKETADAAKVDASTAKQVANDTRTSLINLSAQVQGIGRSYVIDTFAHFIEFLNNTRAITLSEDRDGNGVNETYTVYVKDLKSGDNILITEKNVPDFWIEKNGAVSDLGSYEYNGTTYSLGVTVDGSKWGRAHILETDYTVIEGHATSAAASAKDAQTAEANAKTSETNAKTSETNASASATAAGESASSASASATTATNKAAEAEASATAAAESATAAENAAENARYDFSKYAVSHTLGESDTSAMSQNAVTKIIGAVKKFIAVDVSNIVGYVINGVGTITSASSYAYITDYIPVSAGQVFHISGSGNWGNAIYAYYDENKSVVSVGKTSVSQSARTFIDEDVVVPNGVSYMVVSGSDEFLPKAYTTMLVTLSDKYIYKAAIDGAGVVQVKDTLSETVCVTDYIPVTVGRSYHIKGSANWGGVIYAYYDENKSVVRIGATSPNQSARTYVDEDITIPNGAVYIVVGGNTDGLPTVVSNTEYYYEIPKKWSGKKWACVGDSLTEKNIRTTKNYHDYVADDTGITVINMGISGTGYKRRYENSQAFYQRVSSISRDVDVVTIFGSGNDLYMYGDVLGEATDTGTDTLCGCINTTIDNLYAILPTVQLGIVTPTPWDAYSLTNPNNIMERYSDKLIEICKRRGIPCLDLYRCSGLRPWDETFRTLAYSKDDGGGTHPDETGHAMIAPRFKAFLETLLM